MLCDKPYSDTDKTIVSIILGLLFLILSSPPAYYIYNSMITFDNMPLIVGSTPTIIGILFSASIFTLIVRLMLNNPKKVCGHPPYTNKDKWIVSLMTGLLYILLSYFTIKEDLTIGRLIIVSLAYMIIIRIFLR
jgi:hypothetical protein